MSLPRFAAKALADRTGYFWLPCPFPGCGEMFAGFEAGEYTIWFKTDEGIRVGTMTCHKHDHLVREEVEKSGLVYVKGMKLLKWLTRTR